MRTIALLLAGLAVGCTHSSTSETTGSAPSAEAPVQASEPVTKTNRPVIATLETNRAKISILGGRKDGEPLRVVVRDLNGTVIADGITTDELRRTDPMLGELVDSAFAKNGEVPKTYLDATL